MQEVEESSPWNDLVDMVETARATPKEDDFDVRARRIFGCCGEDKVWIPQLLEVVSEQ